jgi:hypothetical protein
VEQRGAQMMTVGVTPGRRGAKDPSGLDLS